MQEGMLFHTLAATEEGMYIQQLVLRVVGDLKVEAFEMAWSRVVARHQALRSAFVWESAEKPLQVIFRKVTLASRHEDWRSDPSRAERLRELVEADRTQSFDLRRPPLLRLIFVRMGERDYRFIFTYHHMLLDGWSGSVVFKEVLALYEALCRGVDLQLPPPVGIESYAEWARRRKLTDAEGFFRKYLAGLRAPTPLYRDLRGQRATSPGSGFDMREMFLSAPQTARLGEFARAHRLTLSTVLQGAWAAMLSRHSGESDVLFGAISSGRPAELAGMDDMVGMFVNTLPARIRIDPDDTLVAWLQRLQREMAELRQYEYAPLVKIHAWSEIPPGTPLFETCQVWENVALDVLRPFAIANLQFTMEHYSVRTSDPITMLAFPGSQLKVQLLFNCSRVAPRSAERLLGHLETWLAEAPHAADQRVTHIRQLTDAETELLTEGWMGARVALPSTNVHQLFSEQVRRTPDARAVEDGEIAYTYQQLDARANQIANALRGVGVARGTRVGICLKRSSDMVAAVLGVLKANAAYVPLDPAYPSSRVQFMAQDAQVTALITEEGCFDTLTLPDSTVLFLDRDREQFLAQPIVAPIDESQPDDVAYVLYTSGSTGVPKGVQVLQKSLLNLLLWSQELPLVAASDVLLAVTSLSFDIAGVELLAPLLVGARLVVAPPAAVADATILREWLERSGATVMQGTPATWRMLLATSWRPSGKLRILTAGEALMSDLARQLCFGGGEVWNLYGPTETTIYSTAWKVDPAAEEMSIGRPVNNTRLLVVDGAGQAVPVGVAGELLIGGLGVALGYLNRPELTAERFVQLSPDDASRVYRTGDLVRWREDGTLDYLGRRDHQVKIRGNRVELGEIESVLNDQPMVRHAAVSVVEDASGEQAIVAYVVAESVDALGEAGLELDGEHVEDWQRTWDHAYDDSAGLARTDAAVEPTFNTRGWISSYDGNPIAAEQMREWLASTVSRITSLGPRRMLEIGCGSGMLLFRLAPGCDAYLGTDFSKTGLADIAANVSVLGDGAHRVSLLLSEASDLSGVADGSVDTVILNSVAQYFPGVAKMMAVLERGVQKLGPRGNIFVGDVRDFDLHSAFWTSVHMHNAEPSTVATVVREQVERSLANEKELLLHRSFFGALLGRIPRISSARVLVKRGRGTNEMVRFRYDVVLGLNELDAATTTGTAAAAQTVDWSASGMTLAGLGELLSSVGAEGLVVRSIPNGRILRFVLASRLLRREGLSGSIEALEREAAAGSPLGVDPEDVWAIAEAAGLSAELTLSLSGEEYFDAIVQRTAPPVRHPAPPGAEREPADRKNKPSRPWHEYGNNPLQGRLDGIVSPVLRRSLGDKLPSFMVPSSFVFLGALPLTSNGKVNRRALPHPTRQQDIRSKSYMSPRDALELQLVRIWEDVLGVSPIGVFDDFFELGGHSIMSVRLVAQVEKRLGKRLPLWSVVDARTVEAFAQRIRATQTLQNDEVLVCVQAGGKKPPLFCVHPAGGDVVCYQALARALGPDYPVYACASAVDARGAIRDRTVASMAAAYVSAMRRVQPNGPYRVAGWSLGGLVAAEMAESLRNSGDTVAFVGLFDTVIQPPGVVQEFIFDVPRRIGFVRYIEEYFGRPLNVSTTELAERQGEELVSYLAERMQAAKVLPPGTDVAYASRLFATYADHTKAYFQHQPSRFTSRITLMRARTSRSADLVYVQMPTQSRTLGWSEHCVEPVTVIDVPGDHMTLLSPRLVRELAERLRTLLDESEVENKA
jgi:amino acid adenylation domain-containing protein